MLRDKIQTAGAQKGEITVVMRAKPNVFNHFLVTVMLNKKIGLPADG